MVTYFPLLEVGCRECCEPTTIIDIFFDEDKARSAALKLAVARVDTERVPVKLEEGPSFSRDHPELQTCIAYWGPLEIHKVEAMAAGETGGNGYPRASSRDASGAPTTTSGLDPSSY